MWTSNVEVAKNMSSKIFGINDMRFLFRGNSSRLREYKKQKKEDSVINVDNDLESF